MLVKLKGNTGVFTPVADILRMVNAGLNVDDSEATIRFDRVNTRLKLALSGLDEEMPEGSIKSVIVHVPYEKPSAWTAKNIMAFWGKYGRIIFKAFENADTDFVMDGQLLAVWELLNVNKDINIAVLNPLISLREPDALDILPEGIEIRLVQDKLYKVFYVLDFMSASVRHCEEKNVRLGDSKKAENEAFCFRTLCNNIGLSGPEHGDMRKWALSHLDGDSAWRFKGINEGVNENVQ